ncbi:hypothetical protein, partial [Pelagicoccus sp. SDUM812003]|uniref:hypothetical protein n=1 Tax=Pelagicoccus sp. SDUM812003 TaxID=3041267 RepID=UPI00280CAE13
RSTKENEKTPNSIGNRIIHSWSIGSFSSHVCSLRTKISHSGILVFNPNRHARAFYLEFQNTRTEIQGFRHRKPKVILH